MRGSYAAGEAGLWLLAYLDELVGLGHIVRHPVESVGFKLRSDPCHEVLDVGFVRLPLVPLTLLDDVS